jgi:hypothetical protein
VLDYGPLVKGRDAIRKVIAESRLRNNCKMRTETFAKGFGAAIARNLFEFPQAKLFEDDDQKCKFPEPWILWRRQRYHPRPLGQVEFVPRCRELPNGKLQIFPAVGRR